MTQYQATINFKEATPEAAAQKLLAGLYAANIDADTVKIEQVADGGEVFSYPFTQKLIRHLEERQDGEGDHQLRPSEAGGDV